MSDIPFEKKLENGPPAGKALPGGALSAVFGFVASVAAKSAIAGATVAAGFSGVSALALGGVASMTLVTAGQYLLDKDPNKSFKDYKVKALFNFVGGALGTGLGLGASTLMDGGADVASAATGEEAFDDSLPAANVVDEGIDGISPTAALAPPTVVPQPTALASKAVESVAVETIEEEVAEDVVEDAVGESASAELVDVVEGVVVPDVQAVDLATEDVVSAEPVEDIVPEVESFEDSTQVVESTGEIAAQITEEVEQSIASTTLEQPAVVDEPSGPPEPSADLNSMDQLAGLEGLSERAQGIQALAMNGSSQALGDSGLGLINERYGFPSDPALGLELLQEAALDKPIHNVWATYYEFHGLASAGLEASPMEALETMRGIDHPKATEFVESWEKMYGIGDYASQSAAEAGAEAAATEMVANHSCSIEGSLDDFTIQCDPDAVVPPGGTIELGVPGVGEPLQYSLAADSAPVKLDEFVGKYVIPEIQADPSQIAFGNEHDVVDKARLIAGAPSI